MLTKPSYSGNSESTKGWQEMNGYKTTNNKSSVTYDIISNGESKYSGAQVVRALDKKLNNRKKGISEYCDLLKTSAANPNEGHQHALSENPKVFHRQLGPFSNTYDAAVKNGDFQGPFKGKK
eukprot:TRINITY_DN16523_c0_g2_i1.p1 TRINITY_DN16523_c0_g2~~TRINITY_DN16523_c0_g2_i1.p1  ORF type:complete len:122 (-),score=38.16 TRINITY_DN16523_c0_g2_i1:59-424(-)